MSVKSKIVVLYLNLQYIEEKSNFTHMQQFYFPYVAGPKFFFFNSRRSVDDVSTDNKDFHFFDSTQSEQNILFAIENTLTCRLFSNRKSSLCCLPRCRDYRYFK